MQQFLRDKFEVILVTIVLLLVFGSWVQSDYRSDLKEFVIIVFGAWLALLRVVQKPSTTTVAAGGTLRADSISAESIDTANTEQGDIISGDAPNTMTSNKE
jgi:hypothetical protein